MSHGLWVEYKTDKKTSLDWIPIQGCEFIDDLIKEIKNDSQLGVPKNSRIGLSGPSGMAIEANRLTSSLLSGNSPKNPLHIQVSNPFPNASKPGFDAELTSYWNSLREIPNKDGILHFPVRPSLFPDFMKGIYVRKAFEELFAIILNNLNLENPEKSIHRITITGTPGTGKSVFLFYVLWRLANMEARRR